jgi:hypothetical protein
MLCACITGIGGGMLHGRSKPMAKRGRPVKGAELVDELDEGSAVARQRLCLILQTLAGAITIRDACEVLGVGRSRFQAMRRQFLERAAGLLEPKAPGRRRRQPTPAELEVERLRQEVAQLKLDLRATQVREEIAMVMPHLLRDRRRGGGVAAASGKKTSRTAKAQHGTSPGRTSSRNDTRGGSTNSHG